MLRNTSMPQMTKSEIDSFRSHMRDVMTGNVSKNEAARMVERRRQIDSTYNEFVKANGGKNPILGI